MYTYSYGMHNINDRYFSIILNFIEAIKNSFQALNTNIDCLRFSDRIICIKKCNKISFVLIHPDYERISNLDYFLSVITANICNYDLQEMRLYKFEMDNILSSLIDYSLKFDKV